MRPRAAAALVPGSRHWSVVPVSPLVTSYSWRYNWSSDGNRLLLLIVSVARLVSPLSCVGDKKGGGRRRRAILAFTNWII